MNASNPLDFPGNAVQFEAFNIKPSSSKKDDVPYYRLTLEVKKTAWEKFQDATLKGATFAIVCNRVDFDNATAIAPNESADDPFVDANREAAAKSLNDLDMQIGVAAELGFQKESTSPPREAREIIDIYILCRDMEFHQFIVESKGVDLSGYEKTEDGATWYVKKYCSAIAFGTLVDEFERWKKRKI